MTNNHINHIKLSPNFSLHEFQCNDGSHQVVLHPQLLTKLQQLRTTLNRPIIITSGYRSPSHNKAVGGSPTSQHLQGTAADIQVPGSPALTIDQLAHHAKNTGFTGIGRYTTFLHVDVRPHPSYWDYR